MSGMEGHCLLKKYFEELKVAGSSMGTVLAAPGDLLRELPYGRRHPWQGDAVQR